MIEVPVYVKLSEFQRVLEPSGGILDAAVRHGTQALAEAQEKFLHDRLWHANRGEFCANSALACRIGAEQGALSLVLVEHPLERSPRLLGAPWQEQLTTHVTFSIRMDVYVAVPHLVGPKGLRPLFGEDLED